ncbi:MAG: HD domain-containing protein [Eubacterium sp.]|nr:HD domain-containing protein [Eubacterium sp.]
MVALYYEVIFGISFLLTVIYVMIWRKHFDLNITVIFILVPIVNLGYYLYANSADKYAAMNAYKIIYIGSCFLPFFVTMCVLNLCEIEVPRPLRFFAFLINTTLYLFVLTVGKTPYFLKSLTVYHNVFGTEVKKEYGPVHTAFLVVIILYVAIEIVAIVYSSIRKSQISNTILRRLFFPVIVTLLGYLGNKLIGTKIEVVPFTYIFAQIMYISIARRMSLYKVSDMVVDSMVQTGETGFISIDFDHHYLGSNETAREILPGLVDLSIDQDITRVPWMENTVGHWIHHFEEDETKTHLYVKNDKIEKVYKTGQEKLDDVSGVEESDYTYIVRTQYLYEGNRKIGYQIFLTDDTKNQKYVALLDKYKTELEAEVKQKTQHIVEMHDNLILSMATMVESRDNSTGGHIKRTSECVRIIIGEMRADAESPFADRLTDEFCEDIIKAAPMHDLGKVAVDDKILRKPGRFTDEEYEIMKTHAAEGARIVHEILKDTDNESFKIVAENVAHYHHERMDGSGYPEHLEGDKIPLEARIMAIADVYDALVSKRVYKESMSFEQADKIMMESMGKHFDKQLEKYYISARPKLEAYYTSLGEQTSAKEATN